MPRPVSVLAQRQAVKLFFNAEQLDEFTEDLITQLVQSLDVRGGFLMNFLGIDFAPQRGDFVAILADAEPAMDHPFVDFQVKLKAVDIPSVAKGLVGAQ